MERKTNCVSKNADEMGCYWRNEEKGKKRVLFRDGGLIEMGEERKREDTSHPMDTADVTDENSDKFDVSNCTVKNRSIVSVNQLRSGDWKKPSFVTALAPLLRQWSKFATAISTTNDGQTEEDGEERESTAEDAFLQRFSNPYWALSTQTSVNLENGHVNKISRLSEGRKDGGEKMETRLLRKWIRPGNGVVSPDGTFVFYWLALVTFCVLYNWWTLIVRQSFIELKTSDAQCVWFILDTCTDTIFVVDLFIQLRTGYLEQGLLVVNSKKLAKRYLWSMQFVLDALSPIPLDYFPSSFSYPILRFPRFIKSYRVVKFYYMLESRTVYPNAIRVANWCHILLLACHWFACFHFMTAGIDQFRSRWTEWTLDTVANASLTSKYLLSLYWSTLTLTTIGTTAAPGTQFEYLFTIISYLIGVFVFAAIVGQVGNVITNRNARRLEFERLSDGAKQYMRYHKVPKDMQRRVQQWFDYSWSRGRMAGSTDTQALSVLPDKLKTELALRVNLDTLRKVTMFQECQPQFLHDLVLKMRAVIFTPGDLVCRKGEVAREMYIIADGVLEVINEEGETLRVMRSGDFFGEIGLLNLDSGLNKRSADVRSVGYSELFCLSKEDVLAATRDYPDAEAILREHGRRRLENTGTVSRTMSQCSKGSLVSVCWRGRQSTGDQMSTVVAPLTTRASSSSFSVHNRRSIKLRIPRSSQSERPNLNLLVPDGHRSRSSSLADAIVAISRQAAAPSRITNLLGCPIEEKGAVGPNVPINSNGFDQEQDSFHRLLDHQQSHQDTAEHTQWINFQSRLAYTCNEEMSNLENAMRDLVCPRVYSNVTQEIRTVQHAINCKFRFLLDIVQRTEDTIAPKTKDKDSIANGLPS